MREILDGNAFKYVCECMLVAKQAFQGGDPAKDITVRFYSDDAIAPRCTRKSQGIYSIYFPTGVFNRLYLLLTIMLSPTLDRLGLVEQKLSPTDKRDVANAIPGRLRCIFDPEHALNSDETKSLLAEFALPARGDQLTRLHMLSAAFLFFSYHELAHIDSGHFELAQEINRKPDAWDSKSTLGMTRKEILEGLEVSADQQSARSLTGPILAIVQAESDSLASGRVSIAEVLQKALWPFAVGLACAVTLTDWRSRSFDVVTLTNYPHPVVRWSIIQGVIREELGWDSQLGMAWFEHSNAALRFVNGRIGAAYLSEVIKVNWEKPGHPIAQLQVDRNLFGNSVLFEYIIRSVERGRRAEYILSQFRGGFLKLLPAYSDVDRNWEEQLNRFRLINERRNQALADPLVNPFSQSPTRRS
ncbi:MAG: hypothetical protein EPO10_18940 [Reyranella sp.]|nr:MAG: hypothetical protein EPO41_05690 [Reyranella sp.]TBR27278.1 MAG: hypothetical protein EPO10_18940 [Reyranella sp.]